MSLEDRRIQVNQLRSLRFDEGGWNSALREIHLLNGEICTTTIDDILHLASTTISRYLYEGKTLLDSYLLSSSPHQKMTIAHLFDSLSGKFIEGYGIDGDALSYSLHYSSVVYPKGEYRESGWPDESRLERLAEKYRDFPVQWKHPEGTRDEMSSWLRDRVLLLTCPAIEATFGFFVCKPYGNNPSATYRIAVNASEWRDDCEKCLELLELSLTYLYRETPDSEHCLVANPLTPNDRIILEAMVELGAVSAQSPISSGEILQRAGVPESGTVWENLRSNRLIASKPGVGRWLTDSGCKAAASEIRDGGLSPS